MRERVWAAANVQLDEVTVDTETTVHTLFGKQMGGRKGYNPKNKGKFRGSNYWHNTAAQQVRTRCVLRPRMIQVPTEGRFTNGINQ
jgi:hypothetical protein